MHLTPRNNSAPIAAVVNNSPLLLGMSCFASFLGLILPTLGRKRKMGHDILTK